MQLFRSILLIFALLVQAMPVTWAAALSSQEEEACPMSCCAWIQKAAMADNGCGCMGSSSEIPKPAPVQTPPVSGRDLVPTPLWLPVALEFTLPAVPTVQPPQLAWAETQVSPQLHVRLPVLFCSFLT